MCAGAGSEEAGGADSRLAKGVTYCCSCTLRIKPQQPSRPHGAGRAHVTCLLAQKRAAATPLTLIQRKQRSKRPYDAIGPTQQWKRKKQATEAVAGVLHRIGVPLAAILPPSMPAPADLMHLPTSVREQIRSVRGLRIPSEKLMIRCKKLLAVTHATETGTFASGAYITDPVRYVSVLCAQSPFLAVGGDKGDDHTKLGITYSVNGVQHFAPLIVYAGDDDWQDMNELTAPSLTPFTGDSAAFPHIFAVLQHLIDTRNTFLNGDWCFINAVLGLMSPSATHPCPICIISHKSFTKSSRYRTPADQHSVDPTHPPLLSINPERIVPTPLHLFLGISNRIILDAFSELLGKELVEATLEQVKTIHSAGCGGRSDVFQLNGPEIRKWIKQKCSASILAAAAAAGDVDSATRASHSILSRWLQQLHDHLLHKGEWTSQQITDWRAAVDDIQQHWSGETGQAAFPKLHMLRHSLEFAERHRFLGRASEAQIESYHRTFKELFNRQHLNMAHNDPERQRRTLVDTTLRAVQPLTQQ